VTGTRFLSCSPLGTTSQSQFLRSRHAFACALFLVAQPLLPGLLSAQADEYSFEVEEFDKPHYAFGGFLELSAAASTLNRDGAQYRLEFMDEEQRRRLTQYGAALQLEGGYTGSWFAFNFRVLGSGSSNELESQSETVVQEAYLASQPSPASTLELGKRVVKWGKGYAWNPVAFVERPKDPTDPELTQEGFVMARGETIQSFQSELRNVAFVLVILPVNGDVNDDFGAKEGANVAGKLTLLLWDTDVDLLALGGATRSARYGLDFSRNLGSNLELHGEWASISDVDKPVLTQEGQVQIESGPADVWLLGLRHLTEFELTTIVEYYSNGAGYTRDELETYYRFVDQAWNQFHGDGNGMGLNLAAALQQAYLRPNPGRRYAYLRMSQKEPFGWLYVTPGAIAIVNLEDNSRSLTTELTYIGITNIELRGRLTWLQGEQFTEFGEKQSSNRAELRLRWFF
jgi:hypothetical protein